MTEPDIPATSESEASDAAGTSWLRGAADPQMSALIAEYEAKLDEVAELISRVRHEINNPLTGVLGQAQLLLREDLNERARKRAETIEELAVRIRDVVAQLRQVQRAPRDDVNQA
jgi:signal transduction histidine kinase